MNNTNLSVTLLNDAIKKMQHDISSGDITPPSIDFVDTPAIDLFTPLLDKYNIYPYDDKIASISRRSTYSNPYGNCVVEDTKAYLSEFLEEYFEEVLKLVCNKLDDYMIKETE